jgi:hypothetical protein
MPYDDPDPTDPMTLHGVGVETDDPEAMRHMAACFVEEYLRMGFDARRVLLLFQTRGYAGPHLAYETLGEPAIQALIDECVRRRRPRPASSPQIQRNLRGEITLPVID